MSLILYWRLVAFTEGLTLQTHVQLWYSAVLYMVWVVSPCVLFLSFFCFAVVDLLLPVFVSFVACFSDFLFCGFGDFGQWIRATSLKSDLFVISASLPDCLHTFEALWVKRDTLLDIRLLQINRLSGFVKVSSCK